METDLPIVEYWYRALRERIGLKIATNDADRLRAKLYAERKKIGDPQLDVLMLHTSPLNPKGELWISHRSVDLEGPSDG